MPKFHTADIQRYWNDIISQRVFGNSQLEKRPLTVFLGGQSGAGKTAAIRLLRKEYTETEDQRLVYINPDDYRRFHPDFTKLMETNPLAMSSRTARAVSMWTIMAFEQANRDGYPIIVEGTWNTPERIIDQMRQAQEHERMVHMVALATPPALSRLAILERYYNDKAQGKPARWVSPAFHDRLITALPEHVNQIADSGLPDRFLIVERDGTIGYYGHEDGYQFTTDWKTRFDRPLEDEEAEFIHEHAIRLQEMIQRIDPDNEEALTAVQSLIDTANLYRQAPPEYPDDESEQPRKPNGEYDFKG